MSASMTRSPAWPNGVCPRSWPSAIASVSSSCSRSTLAMRARDLRHLERVRQPRAVVIAGRREEHLRLVLQPAERLAVDDAVAIALKRRPDVVFGSRAQAAARVGALGGLRREDVALALLRAAREGRHRRTAASRHRDLARRKLVPCASGRRRRPPPASGRGRRTSAACRGRRRPAHAAPVDEQRHVLARVIGARRRRIVAVVGGHDRADRPRAAAAAAPASRASNRSRLRGVAARRRCGGRTACRSRRGWRRSGRDRRLAICRSTLVHPVVVAGRVDGARDAAAGEQILDLADRDDRQPTRP